MDKQKVIILATEGLSTNLLYEVLSKHYDIQHVIIEKKISKKIIIKNRIKKVGLLKVIGQLIFMVSVPKILALVSKERVRQILNNYALKGEPIPTGKIINSVSVNHKNTIDLIKQTKPCLIFVNGTRIISKHVIDNANCKLINIHVGITPKYRGVHGGFWALYNKQSHLFGTTLHYVDSGVDTGGVIEQQICEVSPKDNFSTYPILQFCLGLKLIEKNIINMRKEQVVQPMIRESNLYYHPTIGAYLKSIFY